MMSYRPSLRISLVPNAPTSSGADSKIVFAAERGVPRFQSFTIRGYPDVVIEPGPKSVPTQTVSSSRQATLDLASGRAKPLDTNSFFLVSNSRTTAASEPPCDSSIRQRVWAGGRQVALLKTQDLPSAFA